jgi:hypothetical protein
MRYSPTRPACHEVPHAQMRMRLAERILGKQRVNPSILIIPSAKLILPATDHAQAEAAAEERQPR